MKLPSPFPILFPVMTLSASTSASASAKLPPPIRFSRSNALGIFLKGELRPEGSCTFILTPFIDVFAWVEEVLSEEVLSASPVPPPVDWNGRPCRVGEIIPIVEALGRLQDSGCINLGGGGGMLLSIAP